MVGEWELMRKGEKPQWKNGVVVGSHEKGMVGGEWMEWLLEKKLGEEGGNGDGGMDSAQGGWN